MSQVARALRHRAVSLAPGLAVIVMAGWTLGGCQGRRMQSSLHPAGPAAQSIATLWWVLFAVLTAYTVVVFALTLYAILRRSVVPDARSIDSDAKTQHDLLHTNQGTRFVLLGGVVLPAIIVVPLLVYSMQGTADLRQRDGGLEIEVIGRRWWWEVRYPQYGIYLANELVIPAGQAVTIRLRTSDVIHSFWVPELHGKMDMIPEVTRTFWLEANREGVYRGQCAEFCGTQHALMGFEVLAVTPETFVDWVSRHRPPPVNETMHRWSQHPGFQAYVKHGCSECHAIRGTIAKGNAGPDLTWFAERRTLAAATLPNETAYLRQWLLDPQSVKPGAKMPPTKASDTDIELIISFLQSLHADRQSPSD